MICHPTANFLGHYALPASPSEASVRIGFTTRYVGNDTSLIMENCLLDMGTMVEHLYAAGLREGRALRQLGRGLDRAVLPGASPQPDGRPRLPAAGPT